MIGLNMKTELVLLSFLQCANCDEHEFVNELLSLARQVKAECPSVPLGVLAFASSLDGDLQTDGSHLNRHVDHLNPEAEDSEPHICMRIGRRLAEMGDELDKRIHQEAIDQCVQTFRDDRLPTEEKSAHLSKVIDSLTAASIPPGMEIEKAKLLLALLLARKVASSAPGLLQHVFWTTVGFINENLRSYIDSLTRHGNALCTN